MDKEQRTIRMDRLRFEKNKTSALLCYGSILFNALYFVSLYSLYGEAASRYYYYMMGVSVVYNLVFMLAAFLSSEGIKNYKMSYAIIMIVVGVLQIVRIFIWPMEAYGSSFILKALEPISKNITSTIAKQSMELSQFILVTIYLILSAVTAIGAGILGIIRSKQLTAHMQTLNKETTTVKE
ncbi:MAG: hypothetical protein ACI4M6_07110 [Christensenellaceae bacterium]